MNRTIETIGNNPQTIKWLFLETQDDDFLFGKVQEYCPDIWEDEE